MIARPRRRSRWTPLVAALAATLMAATACSSAVEEQGGGGNSASSGEVKEGGVLDVGTTVDLVPAAIFTNSNDTINTIIGQVYDSLVDYPSDSLEPQPSLAKSWQLADDGLSLTLHLQDGVTYHSGRPFTSKDVEFSIKTWADPAWTVQFQRTAAAVTGFDTSDPNTVVLSFDHPLSNIFDLLDVMPIIDQDTFADLKTGKAYVGTGPFEFVSWTPQSEVVFKRNDDYWRNDVPLEGVDLHIVPDAQTLVSQLRSGQLDLILGASNRDMETLAKSGQYDVLPFEGAERQTYVGTNVTNPALKDVRVREAIAYALDRDRVVDEVYRGVGYPIVLPWPKYSPAYSEEQNAAFDRDIEKAKALVKQVGTIPTLPLEYSTANPNWEAIALIVQANLKEVGINVELKPNENAVQIEKLIGGKFEGLWMMDHAYAQWTPSTLAVTAYPFNADSNSSNYVDAGYKKDADAAWTVPDGSSPEAVDKYKAVSSDLFDSQFLIEISATYMETAVGSYVHGVTWTKRSEVTLGDTWLDQ